MIYSDAPPTHARFRYDRQLRSPRGPHCHTAGSYASRDGDAGKVPGKLPYCGHVLADRLRFIPRSACPSIRPSRSVTEVTGCTAGFPRMLRSPARRTSIPCHLPRAYQTLKSRGTSVDAKQSAFPRPCFTPGDVTAEVRQEWWRDFSAHVDGLRTVLRLIVGD